MQPLFIFAYNAAPTLFLLLFLNRGVRAIGPVLLVLMIIVGIGGMATTVGFSTYAGMTVKRLMPFLGYGPWVPLSPVLNFEVVNIIGMLLLLPLGWLAIAWVRHLYDRKWFSEQSFVFDSIWLVETLRLCRETTYEGGPIGLGLSAFAVYKLITWSG